MTTPFVPLEERIPAWLTARAIIGSLVPEQLSFRADPENNAISIDWRWAQQIVDFAPPEDSDATVEMVNAMIDAVAAQIPFGTFEYYYTRPITSDTVLAMDTELTLLDRQAQAQGRPTFTDWIRHHLGLQSVESPAIVHLGVRTP